MKIDARIPVFLLAVGISGSGDADLAFAGLAATAILCAALNARSAVPAES